MLDYLKNGWAENYILKLIALKSIGFEDIWKTEMHPRITEQIIKKQESIKNIDISKLFKNIAIMKNAEVIPDVKIFVSFLMKRNCLTMCKIIDTIVTG